MVATPAPRLVDFPVRVVYKGYYQVGMITLIHVFDLQFSASEITSSTGMCRGPKVGGNAGEACEPTEVGLATLPTNRLAAGPRGG